MRKTGHMVQIYHKSFLVVLKACEGDQKLLKEKWVSFLFHMRNRHTWETDKNFTPLSRCAHPPLPIHQEEDVEWLEVNSLDFQALEVIVLVKGLLKDLGKLTEFCHTGQIEVFHSLINKQSPKRQHFFTASQYARHQQSVMDYNSGTERDYKRSNSGDVVTKIQYSKSSKCWVSKPVRKKKQKKYLQEMMEEVVEIKAENITLDTPNLPKTPANIATNPRPENMDSR